jgi:hypothetical protein
MQFNGAGGRERQSVENTGLAHHLYDQAVSGVAMETTRKVKAAVLAAGSLLAAVAALAPAHAADFDAAAFPAVVEASITPAVTLAGDHDDSQAMSPARRIAWIAAAATVLAGLIKLIGAKKIVRAARQTATKAAEVTGDVVKAAARAVASPLRFGALIAGLALFALTGVGLYDIEWIGGLIAGAAIAGVSAYGLMKARMALKKQPVRARKGDLVNRN